VALTYAMLQAVKRDKARVGDEVRAHAQRHVRFTPDALAAELRAAENLSHDRDVYVFLDGAECGDAAPAPPQTGAVQRAFASNPPEDVFAAYERVDPSKSAGDVEVPLVEPEKGARAASELRCWSYADYTSEEVRTKQRLPICPRTMRPYHSVKDATWKEAARDVYGLGAKDLVPFAKLYGDFVLDFKRFPGAEDLLVYAAKKLARSEARGRPQSLPSSAHAMAEATVADFVEALHAAGLWGAERDVAVREFAARFRASHAVDARRSMERGEGA